MNELIFNGVYLPKATKDTYFCHEEVLGEDVPMISGRIVTEVRGLAWVAHYECDYLDNALWRSIYDALVQKSSVPCVMLSDKSDAVVTATMKCTGITMPTLFSLRDMTWHGLKFTLREVKPHD